MAKIKQIKVYSLSNSSWKTGDIGADASNIDLASAVNSTATNVEDAIQYLSQNAGGGNKIDRIGDTMTGVLNFADLNFPTTTPSSNYWGIDNTGVKFTDSLDNRIGYLHSYINTLGDQGVLIATQRNINNAFTSTTMYNTLKLFISSNGGYGVGVTNPLAWRNALQITPANIGAQQTLTAGDNISISGSTISATDTTYAAGTTAAAGLVPTGGTNGQVLKRNSTGELIWATDNNTTYSGGTGISISNNSITATSVKDSANTSAITFSYASAGLTNTDWFACWNGYQLRAINPANTRTVIGAATTAAVNAAQSTANHANTIADAINTTHVLANGSAKNVATATDTILVSTTLGKGNWDVIIWARFANNTSGRRAIHISTGSKSTTRLEVNAGITLAPCSGGYAELSMNHLINCTGNTIVNVCCFQASGSTLSCQGRIQAKKLGTL